MFLKSGPVFLNPICSSNDRVGGTERKNQRRFFIEGLEERNESHRILKIMGTKRKKILKEHHNYSLLSNPRILKTSFIEFLHHWKINHFLFSNSQDFLAPIFVQNCIVKEYGVRHPQKQPLNLRFSLCTFDTRCLLVFLNILFLIYVCAS